MTKPLTSSEIFFGRLTRHRHRRPRRRPISRAHARARARSHGRAARVSLRVGPVYGSTLGDEAHDSVVVARGAAAAVAVRGREVERAVGAFGHVAYAAEAVF